MLSQRESDLIAISRIAMIIGLVYHHLFKIPNSGFHPRSTLPSDSAQWPDLINAFVHWGTMGAVPLLSVISGYLFFNRAKVVYRDLLLKRCRSILLPMLLWCAMWLAFAYALTLLGRRVGGFDWADYHFSEFGLLPLLNGIFGITEKPFAFQFWFVHDLVLTLLLAPLIGYLSQRTGALWLVALAVVWLGDLTPFPFFSGNVLFFFAIGAHLAIANQYTLESVAARLSKWTVALGALLAGAILLRILAGYWEPTAQFLSTNHVLKLIRIAGVLFFLGLIFRLSSRTQWTASTIALSQYSFFIFAAHYPTVEIVKMVFGALPYQASTVGLFLSWLAIPIVTVAVCVFAAKRLEAINANFYSLLNGVR